MTVIVEYPPFLGNRVSLVQAVAQGGGTVGCRWFGTFLVDETGRLPILGVQGREPGYGDWVSGRLVVEGLGWLLTEVTIHSPNRTRGWVGEAEILERKPIFETRQRLYRLVREYFGTNGFLEIETPYRVRCPAVETHLEAIPTNELYLITSPELHMKRLLAAGYEKIFQIARVFREDERGPRHLKEFTLVEWYRTWETPSTLMTDCEQLVHGLTMALGSRKVERPFGIIDYRELFLGVTGLDPLGWCSDESQIGRFRRYAEDMGLQVGEEEPVTEIVEGIYAVVVEPTLRNRGTVFITGYPPWAAVLSRVGHTGEFSVADRFELYLDGLEIANAYHELTDPDIHRGRLRDVQSERLLKRRGNYPRDEEFLSAVDSGLPPASGAALGVDRLLMWLLELDDIGDTVAFGNDRR